MNIVQRLTYEYQRGTMITKLIFINVLVFFVYSVGWAFSGLFQASGSYVSFFETYFVLHSNWKHLLLTIWTTITNGFIHQGFWHILFNMLWLYWIGQILEEYIGSRKIVPIYLLGVLVGGLFFVLAYNLFPLFDSVKDVATARGASAGVMAIIWATVTLLPDYRIRLFLIGSVPLIYVALFMSALDLINISGSNAGGRIAHLGGALMGYLYIVFYRKGTDLSQPINTVLDFFATLFSRRRKSNMKVAYKRNKSKPQSRSAKQKQGKTQFQNSKDKEEKLNLILDKINESGYESLSEAEKDFLFKKSNS